MTTSVDEVTILSWSKYRRSRLPIQLKNFVEMIHPSDTVLFLGSGSSIPSGGPSVSALIDHFSKTFGVDDNGYSLSEMTDIIEQKTRNRKKLVGELRSQIEGLTPSGGIKNIPLYDWRSIYTTNYDRIIELSYENNQSDYTVISSNFDFGWEDNQAATKIFKIHGSIEKDVSNGFQAPLILTETDYEHTTEYRERLYTRLANDLNEFDVVILGYSLSDPELRRTVDKASKINAKSHSANKIYLVVFEKDENRALIYENRGIQVVFGGIDEFFDGLANSDKHEEEPQLDFDDPLSASAKLRPVTVDVAHALTARRDNPSGMYNGWPAGYPDIAAGLTYQRILTDVAVEGLQSDDIMVATILAPSGYGKTTCARQTVLKLRDNGFQCFEHASDHRLHVDAWMDVASYLEKNDRDAVIFIDDAHHHLREINQLTDRLVGAGIKRLRFILASSQNLWGPRIKAASIFKEGREFTLKKLSNPEIENLLNLLDRQPKIRALVSPSFSGFSRFEKKRRLQAKCDSEPFVCLRNIFDSNNFDLIILREFAALKPELQDVYRVVAAMEDAGVRVHRQLVIRMLGIRADRIGSVLADLEGIISEYTIDAREAVYGWRGRHSVIVEIVAKHKYFAEEKVLELLEKVIDHISPSYEIEIKTIQDISTMDNGIRRIASKKDQNRLYQRLISLAPSERIPRHRLIKNLIDLNEFEQAETEIRIFEKDFQTDAAVARYKLSLSIRRANKSKGIMDEDRLAILRKIVPFAESRSHKHRDNKYFLREYVELGFEIFKRSSDTSIYDNAMQKLDGAYQRLGDPGIASMLRRFEREMAGR